MTEHPTCRPPVILDRPACERVHGAAREVLRKQGVRVDDPEIVGRLVDAGARLTHANVVQIPEELVDWALHQAPKTVRIAGRDGSLRELGPQGGTMVLTGNSLFITRGRSRSEMRSSDLAELARIVDACPNIHAMVGTSVGDYPPRHAISSGSASWQSRPASTCGRASILPTVPAS